MGTGDQCCNSCSKLYSLAEFGSVWYGSFVKCKFMSHITQCPLVHACNFFTSFMLCMLVADPYAILGVTRDATSAAIKKVYRKLSTKYHPDVNKDDPEAANKFAEIAKAYEILSDDAARESFNIGQFHTKCELRKQAQD